MKKENNNNYYLELIQKLKELLAQKDYEKCYQLLIEEFKMPYIPAQYEKQLQQIYLEVKPFILEKQTSKKMSREEIIETFLDPNNKEAFLDLSILMENFNWQGFEQDIQKIFDLEYIHSNVRASIYNILAAQSFNANFKIQGIAINPLMNKSTFQNMYSVQNFYLIDNYNLQDPTLKQLAQRILVLYIMNTFPKSLFFEFSDESIAFINIAKKMLSNEKSLKLNKREQEIYEIIKSN